MKSNHVMTAMPSTLVHVAVGGLIAVALLREDFGWDTLGIVLVFAALPDLDTFIGLVLPGAHRSLFHSVFLPLGLSLGLLGEWRRRGSMVAERFGRDGYRLGGVAILALVFGGIAPDLVTNGVNLLYPVQDTFVTVNGDLALSSSRGLVQTFVEFEEPDAGGAIVGSTETIHYATGVDPTPGATPEDTERVFPIVDSGMELLLVVVSTTLVSLRLADANR